MKKFYVDYENINCSGLLDINLLSENDIVNIFYSDNANTVKIPTVENLLISKCKIIFHKVEIGTANALDFQLLAKLLLEVNEEDDYYIVSKDNGYNCALAITKTQKPNLKITVISSICEAINKDLKSDNKIIKANNTKPEQKLPQNKNKTITVVNKSLLISKDKRKKIFDEVSLIIDNSNHQYREIAKESVNTIINIFIQKDGKKNAIDTELRKVFGEEKGQKLYQFIKKNYVDLHKAIKDSYKSKE